MMALFLKIVSGLYLALVWFAFATVVKNLPPSPMFGGAEHVLGFLICVALSIPAVALFAFGQVVGDVRAIRKDIHAMRGQPR
jgi:hypothetical protein